MNTRTFAHGLGWFSIALGAVEVAAPRRLGRLIGAERNVGLLRLCGLREIAAGVGILAGRRQAPWIWSRLLGDALDLALLASLLRSRRSGRGGTLVAAAGVLGVTALDAWCARRLGAHPRVDGPTAPARLPPSSPQEDRIDEALMETFPASDAPAHHVTGASERRR